MSDYWDFSPDPSETDNEEENQWIFETAMDERVCPVCAPLDGSIYTESELAINFPNSISLGDIIYVNLHVDCRCSLIQAEGNQENEEE